jgi:F-type H+-transporting ATPase subunit delta
MKGTKSASRYAKALLELAIEQQKTAVIAENMKSISAAYNETKEFQLFLDSPIVNAEKKISVFHTLFADFDKLTLSFIELITKNGRESILVTIAQAYEEQLKAHLGIIPVTLISAQKLDSVTKNTIVEKVQATVKGTLEIEEQIDEAILGGFIVKMGDNRIDASVANQLMNLKQRLTR